MIVINDTSVLSSLAEINELDVLCKLYGKLTLTESIRREASAITLAWRNRNTSLLILDEKRGRKIADALGLRMTGTAGLLTDAAAAGLIDFEDVFRRLSQTGFRLSSKVVDDLRRKLSPNTPNGGSSKACQGL